MANSYLPVDREQRFLLPPDMRDWLPPGHLVWFVLDVVARVDTAVLHGKRRLGGAGRRGYDPDMLLALLVYAYCTKQRSSRQIERLCEADVAYRVVCGGQRPDHTTIARFRADHADHAVALFTDVLVVCAEAGLATVGAVAVDGTKMGTDAGLAANRTRESIQAEVRAMMAEAGQVDAEQDQLFGDARGDELPAELADPTSRGARLDAALGVLDQREQHARDDRVDAGGWIDQAWAAAAQGRGILGAVPSGVDKVTLAQIGLERAKQQAAARRAEIEARAAEEGRPVPGVPPGKGPRVARAEAALQTARAQHAEQQDRDAEPSNDNDDSGSDGGSDDRRFRANITDPDSRVMSTANGWVQGYNAQAAVNEYGVVIAAEVTQDHNDVHQLEPMINAVTASLHASGIRDQVGTMLFDAGYWSEHNATAKGPDRLIATTKDYKRRRQLREQGTITGEPPEGASATEAMEHRLCTEQGAALYAKRSHTVEPVFGHTKHNRGMGRFSRRGLKAATAEWLLIHTTGNLLKAFRHQPQPAPG